MNEKESKLIKGINNRNSELGWLWPINESNPADHNQTQSSEAHIAPPAEKEKKKKKKRKMRKGYNYNLQFK